MSQLQELTTSFDQALGHDLEPAPKTATGLARLLQLLTAPFAAAETAIRAIPGSDTYAYLEWETIVNRLNAVMPLGWSFLVKEVRVCNTNGKDTATAVAEIAIHTGEGTRSYCGVGVCNWGEIEKGAISMALTNAALRLGIGFDLRNDKRQEELKAIHLIVPKLSAADVKARVWKIVCQYYEEMGNDMTQCKGADAISAIVSYSAYVLDHHLDDDDGELTTEQLRSVLVAQIDKKGLGK